MQLFFRPCDVDFASSIYKRGDLSVSIQFLPTEVEEPYSPSHMYHRPGSERSGLSTSVGRCCAVENQMLPLDPERTLDVPPWMSHQPWRLAGRLSTENMGQTWCKKPGPLQVNDLMKYWSWPGPRKVKDQILLSQTGLVGLGFRPN